MAAIAENSESTTRGFDYSRPAGLYYSRKSGEKWGISFRRFDTASAAIAFAIEKLDADTLGRTTLEVDEERVAGGAIRRLYDSDDYPLTRNASPSAAAGPRPTASPVT